MPTINAFTVTPSSIVAGESVVVSWTTTGADAVTLNGESVPENGSITDTPTADKSYSLTAISLSQQQTVSVTVTPAPIDCVLSDWSAWVPTSDWSACVDGSQARTEERTRTVITEPANGGAACGPLAETRTATQVCSVQPPPSDEKVILIGCASMNLQYRVGPADRANLQTMRAAVQATPKWTVFADAQERISPSQNGVRATSFAKFHVWGNMNGLYKQIPRLLSDGTAVPVYTPSHDSRPEVAMDLLPAYGAHGGPRGANLSHGWTTWHGHTRIKQDGTIGSPRSPLYIGIRMDGWMTFAFRDGSLADVFQIPGANGTSDFSFSDVDIKIFWVCDTLNGRILKVDRHPGITEGQPENPALWQVTTFATGFVKPRSVREVGGVVYVADDNKIYALDSVGVKTLVASISNAFWIDYQTDGKLVVATLTNAVHVVDPSNGSVGPNIGPSPTLRDWVSLSVDRNGTFGKVDEWSLIAQRGNGNIAHWRYQDGVVVSQPFQQGPGLFGNATVGDTKACQDLAGHYVWTIEHHPDEALLLVQGMSDVFPSLIVVKPPGYPVEDTYDPNAYNPGRDIIRFGTGPGSPYYQKPSLTCFISESCWSLAGCSADFLAEMSFQEFADFTWGGWFGSFRRDEIKGKDLYDLGYVIYRSSQRFLKEGKALMDGWKAFCQPMLGQEIRPVLSQRLPTPSSDVQMEVETVGTNWVVKGKTKEGYAKTLEAGLVVRLYVDEGLPEQQDLGLLSSPWTIAAPTLTPGQHARRCLPVSGVADPGKYRGRATVVLA